MIASSIMLPKNTAPVRWNTSVAAQVSALSQPFIIDEVQFGPVDPILNQQIPQTECWAVAFRQLLRSLVVYVPNTGGLTGSYTSNLYLPGSGAVNSVSIAEGSFVLPYTSFSWTSGAQFHGPTLYCGQDGQTAQRYFWMNNLDLVLVNGSHSEDTSPGTVTLLYWNGRSTTAVQANDIPDSTGDFTLSFGAPDDTSPTLPGYFCLVCTTTGPWDLLSVVLTVPTYGSCFCHLATNQVDSNLGSIDMVRLNAVALMFSNTTPEIQLGGSVTGFQAHGITPWYQYALGGFSKLSQTNGSSTCDANKGIYGFLKPASFDDFAWREEFVWDSSFEVLADSFFDLQPQGDYLIIATNIAVSTSNSGLWTQASHVEYQSDDTWRALAEPSQDEALFAQAIKIAALTKQWHENPLHWDDIWNSIKSFGSKVLGGIVKYGPTVLKGASMLAPLLL